MTRRTTLSAEADDLAILEHEAQRRGVSLAQVLRELVAARAAELRTSRRPRFGVFASKTGDLSELSWRDEDAPYRDPL